MPKLIVARFALQGNLLATSGSGEIHSLFNTACLAPNTSIFFATCASLQWVNSEPHIYLIDRVAFAYLGEICPLDGKSGPGGKAAYICSW